MIGVADALPWRSLLRTPGTKFMTTAGECFHLAEFILSINIIPISITEGFNEPA